MEAQLHEKQALLPLHTQLAALVSQTTAPTLPFPDQAAYPRQKAEHLGVELAALASRYNLNTQSAVPDLQTLVHNTDYLLMRLTLLGDFLNLRPFLISLHDHGYLKHIEYIKIQQDANATLFNLGIWIHTTGA